VTWIVKSYHRRDSNRRLSKRSEDPAEEECCGTDTKILVEHIITQIVKLLEMVVVLPLMATG
jgi:hypothetical protein